MSIKEIIPLNLRKRLLKVRRNFVFKKSFKAYQKLIDQNGKIDDQLLRSLIFGWGNQGFSAKVNYLRTCIEYARTCKGNILECGSGLTTVLISIIAQKRKIEMFSLENNVDYGLEISGRLNQINTTDCAEIKIDSLEDYGDFEWYNTDKLNFGKPFGLIIVDGPPGSTKGGRYGLVPLMKAYFDSKTIFLVDDTSRPAEQKMIEKWKKILNFDIGYPDKEKSHAVLKSV